MVGKKKLPAAPQRCAVCDAPLGVGIGVNDRGHEVDKFIMCTADPTGHIHGNTRAFDPATWPAASAGVFAEHLELRLDRIG